MESPLHPRAGRIAGAALACAAFCVPLAATAAPGERYEELEKKAHELELKGRFLEAQLTFSRALDLNNFRSQISKQFCTIGPGNMAAKFNHLDIG